MRTMAVGNQNCNSLTELRKDELKKEHDILEVFHSIEMKALDTKVECIEQMLIRNSVDVWDFVNK